MDDVCCVWIGLGLAWVAGTVSPIARAAVMVAHQNDRKIRSVVRACAVLMLLFLSEHGAGGAMGNGYSILCVPGQAGGVVPGLGHLLYTWCV